MPCSPRGCNCNHHLMASLWHRRFSGPLQRESFGNRWRRRVLGWVIDACMRNERLRRELAMALSKDITEFAAYLAAHPITPPPAKND